jgi:hypothetical protein
VAIRIITVGDGGARVGVESGAVDDVERRAVLVHEIDEIMRSHVQVPRRAHLEPECAVGQVDPSRTLATDRWSCDVAREAARVRHG